MRRLSSLIALLAIVVCGCQSKTVSREQGLSDIKRLGGKLTEGKGSQGQPYVDIEFTTLKDEDMDSLAPALNVIANEINELDLSRTAVTESGLRKLKDVKGVQMLAVSSKLFNSPVIQELRQANPQLRIRGGGWIPVGGPSQ